MKRSIAFAISASLLLIAFLAQPANSRLQEEKKFLRKADPVANSYIVVLDDSVVGEKGPSSIAPHIAAEMASVYKGRVKHIYQHALNGFSIEMSEDAAEALSQDFRVKFVEEDGRVSANTTQNNAPWGLDRIDQRDRPLNAQYKYTSPGAGVHVYVIDTGIRLTHTQFGGRAFLGTDVIGDGQQDCNGHGTHVAGTIGGSTYGVAKDATLYSVRVFACSTTTAESNLIAGVDWTTANHIKPAVANLSLGGGISAAVDSSINNLINAGVTTVVAAGNENQRACNVSPARVPNALTLGSTTSTDARSSFSNWGTCVDLFAPGSSITSAWHISDTATNTISGTSMASPHAAGVAALYLQNNPSASPATVNSAIINTATTNRLTRIGVGSPNRLLYSLLTVSGGAGDPTAACAGGTLYTGALSFTGDSHYPSYYFSSIAGTHKGCLQGPTSGADFDLYLQKWIGSAWIIVDRSESVTSDETIVYSGTSGYYRWQIYSYSGSGSYNFWRLSP